MKKAWLKWALLLLTFGVIVNYFFNRPEVLGVVQEVNPNNILVLAGISCLCLLSYGLILNSLLRTFNISVPMHECFGIFSLSALGNYVTSFGGGTIGKAVYLKRRYRFPYTDFLASMSATHILNLFLASLLGCSVVSLTDWVSPSWGATAMAGFLLSGFLTFGLLVYPFKFEINRIKIFKVMADVVDGWNIIKRDKGLIIKISLLLLVNHLLAAAELFAGYSAFSISVSIADVILLGVISCFSMVIRVTPANLGIHEVLVALSSHLLGVGFEEGLLAAGLLRVVSLFIAILSAGTFGAFLLLKEKQ